MVVGFETFAVIAVVGVTTMDGVLLLLVLVMVEVEKVGGVGGRRRWEAEGWWRRWRRRRTSSSLIHLHNTIMNGIGDRRKIQQRNTARDLLSVSSEMNYI